MNHEKALGNIGGNKNKATFKQKATRIGLIGLIGVTGGALVHDHGHNSLPGAGQSSTPAVDVGNNVIHETAGRVNKILIKEPKAKNKGEEVVVHFAVNDPGFPSDADRATLSDFAYDVGEANGIHKITSAESAALTTQAIEATNTGNQADGTGGNVEYGVPYYVKVSQKTNLHELEVLAKQDDILVKPS